MAVAYRSVANTTLAVRTNITVTKPSGTVDNDILVAAIHVEGDAVVTPPSGWTLITTVDETAVDIDLHVYWKRASSEGADYTWSFSSNWSSGVIVTASGAITSGDPQDATVGTDNDDGAVTTVNIPSITTATDGSLIIAFTTEYNTGVTATTPTGWDERVDADGCHAWTKTQTTLGATGATTSTLSTASQHVQAVVAIKEASTTTLEQEGFRFGVDDGSESAHTWEAAQDTNITTADAVTKLLRLLVNATGDPAAIAYKLKYAKNGGAYGTVPLVASTKTKPIIEAADCTVSGSNTASASWAVSHPAASTGDLLTFNLAWDDSTTTTGVTAPSGVNGETLTAINSTPATDASTETRAKSWSCICTGSWTATTINFTPSATESWSATVIRVPAGEFDATTPIGASATRGATGVADTSVLSAALTAGASDGGGALVWLASVDTDPLGATNPTGFTILQRQDLGAVAHGVAVRNTEVSNSESIAGGDTWAIAGDSWASVAYIIRAPTTTYDLYISASANITAGGEATTARLTAPSGKTTSDFVTGRRWDDENGTDTTNITTDDYSEFEWNITLRSGLAGGDYFDFRVYNGDVAFDTYTSTPRWTISSGISITLDTATITALGTALTLVPGAVSKALSTASLLATGRAFTVVPGAFSLLLDTASLLATGQASTLLPGAATTLLDTAALLANGQAFTVTPGAFTLTLDTATLTATGQIIQVGNINTILLDTATLSANGQAVTLLPGAVSTLLDTALLTLNGQAFTVIPGASTKILSTALLSASGQALSVIPGDVTKALSTALLSALGQGATLVPGAVTIAMDTAQINASGIAITIQTVGGAVTVILDTATLLAGGIALDVIPGDISTLLDTALLTANGIQSSVIPGGVIIGLDTAALLANGQGLTLDVVLQAVIRAWTLRERDTAWTLENRDTGWTLHNRDTEWSLDDRDTDWSLRGRTTDWNVDDR